jgi:hypothetical protein
MVVGMVGMREILKVGMKVASLVVLRVAMKALQQVVGMVGKSA